MWAKVGVAAGYAVLITDSQTGRGLADEAGIEAVCNLRALLAMERSADIYLALHRIAAEPRARADHVVLMGYSHGGWTTLDLLGVNPPHYRFPGLDDPHAMDLRGVRASILMYPYCGFGATRHGINHKAPVHMFLAAADSLTPATDCVAMVSKLSAGGMTATAHIYDGAEHAFDVERWADGSANADFDPALRDDVIERVRALLMQYR